MKFEDLKFQRDGRPRKWEDLLEEEKECLREQNYKQLKEAFEKNFKKCKKQ